MQLNTIFSVDPFLPTMFWFDKFSDSYKWQLPRTTTLVNFDMRTDKHAVCRYIFNEYPEVADLSLPKLARLIEKQAKTNMFNSIEAEIRAVKWDGTSRIDDWLRTYCGAEDTEANALASRRTLLGAVQRAVNPGSEFPNILVLCGLQGIGKTQVVRTLAGNADLFSSESACALKNASVAKLNTKWFVELRDLNTGNQKEVVAFSSKNTDKVKLENSKEHKIYSRSYVMIATTNADVGYVKDSQDKFIFDTVSIKHCDVDRLERDRAQLFAEALAVLGL